MKKYTLLALLLLLVLMLTACSSKPTEPEATEVPTPEPTVYIDPNLMTIRPAEFSEETQQVLDILNSNLTFFDYTVDESIRSMNLEMWNLSDAGWASAGRTLGNIDSTEGRIGISLTGPAIWKMRAPVPMMAPSRWNSMAGAATELAKPVMGTSAPAPPHFTMRG